jgi:hypothetical protein
VTHIRTLVRQAAVAQLRAAETAARERVFDSRLTDLREADLPAGKVYTTDDAGGARELGPDGAQQRALTLIIEWVIARNSNESDADFAARIDALAAEGEAAIEADPTLGGVCADAELENASVGPSAEGAVDTYLATQSYRVTAMNKGDQLIGGRLSVVTVDGVPIERLRGWGIETAAEPADVTNSQSQWGETKANVPARWSATLTMTLDDDDPGQQLLGPKFGRSFVFDPRGLGGPSYTGDAFISGVSEDVTEDGDVLRTVTITGNGKIE